VKGVYHLLYHVVPPMMSMQKEVIWNKVVPLKVSFFVCKLLNNKLPSKKNFVWHGSILADLIVYIGDCWIIESSNHFFFVVISLNLFGIKLWRGLAFAVLSWMTEMNMVCNFVICFYLTKMLGLVCKLVKQLDARTYGKKK
jgi:hypothetical protein